MVVTNCLGCTASRLSARMMRATRLLLNDPEIRKITGMSTCSDLGRNSNEATAHHFSKSSSLYLPLFLLLSCVTFRLLLGIRRDVAIADPLLIPTIVNVH